MSLETKQAIILSALTSKVTLEDFDLTLGYYFQQHN